MSSSLSLRVCLYYADTFMSTEQANLLGGRGGPIQEKRGLSQDEHTSVTIIDRQFLKTQGLVRRQVSRGFVNVLQGCRMVLNAWLIVYPQVSQGPVLFDADAPEKGRRCRIGAFSPDLPLHTSYQYEKTFSVDLSLDRHIVDVFLAPKRLAPVDHGLHLCGQSAEIYRGRQYNPVGFSDGRVYLLHLILDNTYTGIGASAAILTRFDVHVIEPEIIDLVYRPVDALQCRLNKKVGIAQNSGTSIKNENSHYRPRTG